MKKLNVSHKTKYSFEAGPLSGLQQIKKTPFSDSCQKVVNWSLSLTGAKEELTFIDSFNNNVNLIRIEPGIKDLVIECEGHVELQIGLEYLVMKQAIYLCGFGLSKPI